MWLDMMFGGGGVGGEYGRGAGRGEWGSFDLYLINQQTAQINQMKGLKHINTLTYEIYTNT